MTHHARWAVSLWLSVGAVSACSIEPSAAPSSDEAPAGALRGELAVYSATFPDGTSEYQYFLRVSGNALDERRLRFAANPDLPSGLWLDVWGQVAGREILVDRFTQVTTPSDVESAWRALITADPYRTRTIAFVLVDLGAGVNLTSETALTRVMGTATGDDSVRQFFIENSFGRQDVDGQVFGPLATTMVDCETSTIPTALRSQIPGTFDQYFWYMGGKVAACSWSGLAMVGSPDRPARDTWFNATSGCTVLVHEPGHNLGMKHASSIKCGTDVFVDVPDGVCTHSEYGDNLDAMGSGCRHMNAYTKTYQEWFGGCNMVDVPATGTFNLLPVEVPCDGVQGLQIKMPKARPFYRSGGGGTAGTTDLTHYYVEFRSPFGFDGRHGTSSALKPQVQIRVSGDIRRRTQSGLNTWYLDMVPSTTALDGLVAGGSFSDPAGGITITVDAIDATKATVRVEIPDGTGSPTCMDGVTTLTAPGPGPESCAAGPAVPGAAPVTVDGGLLPPEMPDAGTTRDSSVRRDVARDLAGPDASGTGGGSGGSTGAGGGSGSAGTGGRSGATGTGGATGGLGAGGSSGSSRTGGATGVASSGGTTGSAGTGGSTGSAGSGSAASSSGGAGGTGSGGNAGSGGSGGSSSGAGGAGGGSATTKPDSTSGNASGCTCVQAGRPGSSGGGVFSALLLLALTFVIARRRRG